MAAKVRRKSTFVLVIPSFEDIFHSYYAGEIIKGVSQAASRLKVDVLIHITDRFDHRGWLDSSLLDRNFIEGIIFADIDNDVYLVKKAICRGIPCLVLNNALKEPINFVTIDNFMAAVDVVQHFLSFGHSRIATIAGDQSTQAGQLRLAGFSQALKEAKVPLPKAHITFGDFLRTPARTAARKLLKLKKRPTAVFVASDVMALELLAEARDQGLRVPEDLSVVGFDDNPLALSGLVPLTTVSQPLGEMGRLGMEQLRLLALGRVQLPFKKTLKAELVTRDSVAPCPTKT